MSRSYSAKLLLFGEHVLLLGATALAVPLRAYSGHWAHSALADRHRRRMLEFAHSDALLKPGIIDTQRFERELNEGLYFQSDIPNGYGLGSSGAVCAGIYDRYAREKTEDLSALKQVFAGMESFFHGNSSGIDPLTSYVDRALLIRRKTEVEPAAAAPLTSIAFLIDSQLPRQTAPLVAWFQEQSRKADFANLLEQEYLPAHESAIKYWLEGQHAPFWHNLRRLSAFQLAHFGPLIPETIRPLWQQSLEDESFTIKICGAGGGGFVLGFTQDPDIPERISAQFPLVRV